MKRLLKILLLVILLGVQLTGCKKDELIMYNGVKIHESTKKAKDKVDAYFMEEAKKNYTEKLNYDNWYNKNSKQIEEFLEKIKNDLKSQGLGSDLASVEALANEMYLQSMYNEYKSYVIENRKYEFNKHLVEKNVPLAHSKSSELLKMAREANANGETFDEFTAKNETFLNELFTQIVSNTADEIKDSDFENENFTFDYKLNEEKQEFYTLVLKSLFK